MISRAGQLASSTRVLAAIGFVCVLAVAAIGAADGDFDGTGAGGLQAAPGAGACAATVMNTLGDVAARIYREGIHSERTTIAERDVRRSLPLRRALETGRTAAVEAAARGIVRTGHMTNLTVLEGAHTLASVGSSSALTPLRGSLAGDRGARNATFIVSVWSDEGFLAETDGVLEGITVVRSGKHTVLGALSLPDRVLPDEGSLSSRGVAYRYTSFRARAYPAGSVRIYLYSFRALWGRTSQDTLVNTLRQIASLIYAGEIGPRAGREIRRVQHDRELLKAVAAHNPKATRLAIAKVLNQHIVRLRVLAGRHLLSDVGGPFVLGPRTAPLLLHGRTIGSFVLSIQDDSGYLKLTDRLAGLHILMYMGPRLVMSSVDPIPAQVPAEGLVSDGGRSYRVFTLHLRSFPGGPLRVVVFVPIPYA
jgi:hypothetical protein